MKKTEQSVSDALVDTYRDIMQLKRNIEAPATPGSTPGAGRGCKPGRHVPGKRLRNWHRANRHGLSLRAFARAVIDRRLDHYRGDSAVATATRWLESKRTA